MPPVYTLLAAALPAPVVSSGLLDPAASASVVAEQVAAGTTTAGLAKINRNAVRLDLASRYGGASVFSVKEGLDLTAGSGLTLNISAGVGNIDGHIYHAAGTLALTDATRNYVWLTRAGALSASTTTTPPTANQSLFLGSALTSGGSITAVDYSGRLEGFGGLVWRRTADVGPPLDTPSSAARFFSKTDGGLYLWDGGAYRLLTPEKGTASATAGAATLNKLAGTITSESLTTAAGAAYTLTITNSLVTTGSVVVASVSQGSNTTEPVYVSTVTPGSGSVVIKVYNGHASAALNGTLKVAFSIAA